MCGNNSMKLKGMGERNLRSEILSKCSEFSYIEGNF